MVDRKCHAISQRDKSEKIPPADRTKKYSAFLGLLPVLHRNFMVFVEEVKLVCCMVKHDIFEVATLSFIDLGESFERDEKRQKIEEYLYFLKERIFK